MSDTSPAAFHVMAKPTGARCNLRCDYCFFLEKERLYPDSDFRMSEEVLQAYIAQAAQAQRVPQVTIAWQGGEPTLMGLDFFRRARAAEEAGVPAGMAVERTIQTNGVLLDDEWAAFLAENDYLVGLSIDGPRELHDAYRHDKAGNPVFDRVVAAARLLQRHGVEFNVMCTVNARNSLEPLAVYRYFRDELKANFVQFIPIVEVETPPTADLARHGHRPQRPSRGLRRLPLRDLRRVGPARCGRDVRPVLRRGAGRVRARRLQPVRPPADVRRRSRPRAQRRRVLVRPLRRPRVPPGEHRRDAARRPGALRATAGVRPCQAGDAAGLLPRVRLPVRLQRGVPQEPHPD